MTLNHQRTPSLRLLSTMLPGSGQLGSNLEGFAWREAVITGALPEVSLLVLPSDGWRVLPADLQVYPPIWRAGGRLANTLKWNIHLGWKVLTVFENMKVWESMCKFWKEIIHTMQNYNLLNFVQYWHDFSLFTTPSLSGRNYVSNGSLLLKNLCIVFRSSQHQVCQAVIMY